MIWTPANMNSLTWSHLVRWPLVKLVVNKLVMYGYDRFVYNIEGHLYATHKHPQYDTWVLSSGHSNSELRTQNSKMIIFDLISREYSYANSF